MKITTVGTGTVVPRLDRRQSCAVVEVGGEMLVFDLGSGAVRGMVRAGLDPFGVDGLFFTHFHPDHTVDVVSLLFAIKYGSREARTRPLRITGPEPFGAFWGSLTDVYGAWMLGDYPMPIRELPHTCPAPIELSGCKLSWAPAQHRPESIAYRLDTDEGAFVYTGDTEYSASVVELARGARTLLVECSFPDDNPVQGHLTPGGAARMAREAGVGRMVLTHLFPQVDTPDLAAQVGRTFEGEVIVAEDGLSLEL